jgi:hypothetical protein
MATSIFFNGRVISIPGSYSEVDASGLESVGLGASGIVAVLGTAEGGRPVSAISETKDIPRFTNPDKMRRAFRKGQLREVTDMVFSPAKDPDILAGAQQVVTMKVNPATQSATTLLSGVTPVLTLTSKDYGAFTSQISVEVQPGSSQGKMLTIKMEGVTETVDNLGGSPLATLQYDGGSYGYNTAVMALNDAGDISVTCTRAGAGLNGAGQPAGEITLVTANAVEFAGVNLTGVAATLAVASGTVTATGVTGMIADSLPSSPSPMRGRFITISGATNPGNNGTFAIAAVPGITSVQWVNLNAVAESTGFTWTVSDAGLKVTLYGKSAGLPVRETLTHAGATTVTSSTVWDATGLLGIVMSAAPVAGAITFKNAPGGATVAALAIGQVSRGAIVCENAYVNSASVSLKLSGAGTQQVALFGKDAAGNNVQELIAMTGAVAIASVASTYAELQAICVNLLPTSLTLTLTALAAKSLGAVQTTVTKVKGYFDGKTKLTSSNTVKGFLFNTLTGQSNFAATDFDIISGSGVSIASPATGNLTADLYAIAAWVNQNSQLVSALVPANAPAVPDNTAAPVFLAGGVEGVALFQHYQAALTLLKKIRVNSVVDLSGDPAVAAAVDAHCAYMGGVGRSERDGFVGLLNNAKTDVTTKDDAKAQIVDINSRHIRAFAQAIERYDSNGDRTEFLPPFLGAIAAGAQAGSPVGTSLTFKYMNVLSFRQHSSWNPTEDAEEMITAGLCFLENKEGVGRRIVRNVTTHLSSNNIAYIEGSVNTAVNFAVFNFRTNMEFAVGKRGFSGTLAAARGVAVGTLGLLVDNVVITAYRSLFMELNVDVLEVSLEIAPIIPINFVKTTVHLVTVAQAA